MVMVIKELTLHFLTPAFLGDAEQNARWRTPPIKHLLREWWRVVYAAERGYENLDIAAMREAEGKLFGHAWLENDTYVERNGRIKHTNSRKSQVRLRLIPGSDADAQNVWKGRTSQGVKPLSPTDVNISYAWFGLVRRGHGQPDRYRLEAGEVRTLACAWPEPADKALQAAFRLMHAFGALGSRSRGGWGSLHVEGFYLPTVDDIRPYSQPLEKCLEDDWAKAVASDPDATPWVWRSSESWSKWDEALRYCALWRRDVRRSLKQQQDMRAALGFSAGKKRMPSPLRWKIVCDSDAKLRIQAVAVPHRIPQGQGKSLSTEALSQAWTIVRNTLDKKMKRVS